MRVNLSDSEQQIGTISSSSSIAAISDDGDRVVFDSEASDLVAADTNGHADVFLRTISAGTTTLVSRTSAGAQISTASSFNPDISGDGQRVLFHSAATDAVPSDIAGLDVFVRDLATGTTTCVSRGMLVASGIASSGRISGDGSTVTFMYSTSDPFALDVYVRTGTGPVRRVSVSTTNGPANDGSSAPAIARDGREVVFYSSASNLVPADGNAQPDVFVAVIPPNGGG